MSKNRPPALMTAASAETRDLRKSDTGLLHTWAQLADGQCVPVIEIHFYGEGTQPTVVPDEHIVVLKVTIKLEVPLLIELYGVTYQLSETIGLVRYQVEHVTQRGMIDQPSPVVLKLEDLNQPASQRLCCPPQYQQIKSLGIHLHHSHFGQLKLLHKVIDRSHLYSLFFPPGNRR